MALVVLDLPTTASWNRLERRRRLVEVCLAFLAITYMALLVESVLGPEGMLVGGYILLAAAGFHQFAWERRQLALIAGALPHDPRFRHEADRMALWERGSMTFLVMVSLLYLADRGVSGVALGRFLFILGLAVLAWFMLILHRSTSASRLIEEIEWRTAALPTPGVSSPWVAVVVPLAFVIGVLSFLLITPGPPTAVETSGTLLYGMGVILGLFWFRSARLEIALRADASGTGYGSEAFLWGWEHASYTFGLVAFSILLGVHRGLEPMGGPLTLAWLGIVVAWGVISYFFIRQHRGRLRAAPLATEWEAGPEPVASDDD